MHRYGRDVISELSLLAGSLIKSLTMSLKASDFQIEDEDEILNSQDSLPAAMKPRKTGLDALGFKHGQAERNMPAMTGPSVNHDEIKKNAASIATGVVRDISLRPIPQRNSILGPTGQANRTSEWGTPALKASVSALSQNEALKPKKVQLKTIIVILYCSLYSTRILISGRMTTN